MMKKNPKKKTLKFDVLNYNCNFSPYLNTSSLILMSDGSYTLHISYVIQMITSVTKYKRLYNLIN